MVKKKGGRVNGVRLRLGWVTQKLFPTRLGGILCAEELAGRALNEYEY